jgi:hypothetical protein
MIEMVDFPVGVPRELRGEPLRLSEEVGCELRRGGRDPYVRRVLPEVLDSALLSSWRATDGSREEDASLDEQWVVGLRDQQADHAVRERTRY